MGTWRGFVLGHKVMVSLAICFLGLPGPAALLCTRYQPLVLGEGLWGSTAFLGLGVCWGEHPSSLS